MSRISQKLLFSVTLSVATIILMFVAYVEHGNFKEAVAQQMNEQAMITKGQAILLSKYIYEKNEENTYLTLSGIVANPAIVGVSVEDPAGGTIFSIGKVEERDGISTYKHPITYFEDGKVRTLGEIKTFATNQMIVDMFLDRLWSLGIMAFLVVCAIAAAVTITVRRIIQRPITLLVDACADSAETRPQDIVWKPNDEMGFLVSQFNDLNRRLHNALYQLRGELRDHEILEAERLRCLVDATFESIIIHRDGVILDVNDATCTLLGLSRSELINRNISDIVGDPLTYGPATRTSDNKQFRQHVVQHQDGTPRTVEVSVRELDYRGKPASVAVLRDVTEWIKSSEKIEFLAHFDHLTQLSNRFKFHQDLEDGLLDPATGRKSGAVLCLDLDGFKRVNDFNGHAAGDELLKQVGDRLREMVRKSDAVGRLGGDEFAIAMFGAQDEENISRFAHKLVHMIGSTYLIDGMQVEIGTSIGIALCSDGDETARDMLKRADMALYEAKRSGKGQFKFYRTHMEAGRLRALDIERRLRVALTDGLIDVCFQPQAKVRTGEICGFEALARWVDPVLGQVAPDEFIPIAEQTGLIDPLGEHIIMTACQTAATWSGHYRIAINVSAAELVKSDIVSTVEHALHASGLDATQLEIEITESILIHDQELALQSIQKLKSLGACVALDDFGTGYSCLSVLQRFPFDRIKIDRSFVQAMQKNSEAALIVRSIINLGESLNIGVIAEGVETESVLQKLQLERCDEVQGYLIGEPVPADQLGKYFEDDEEAIRMAS